MADDAQRYVLLSWVNAYRYAFKIGNMMKAAYSTPKFSNDSDYYRVYVKWKQLKER